MSGALLKALALAALVCGAGCRMVTPADSARLVDVSGPAAPVVDAWPERLLDESPVDAAGRPLPDVLINRGQFGRGWMLEWPAEALERMDAAPDGERHLMFLSRRPNGSELALQAVSLRAEQWEVDLLEDQNATFLMIFEPASGEAAPARGAVVYLTGVDGLSAPERRLIRRLTDDGWRVLAATPSTDLYIRTGYAIGADEGAIDRAGAFMAGVIDNHLAERVYAAQAGLELLRAERPDEPPRPLVLIGASAGAIALPALAASLDEPPDAAVLIGGGAPFIRVLIGSPLAKRQLAFVRFDEPPQTLEELDRARVSNLNDEELDRLAEATLELSRLDPYHTAPCLRGVPVLQLHARFDAIVPAATGDVLRERLGRPERWSFAAGHVGLFFLLNFYGDDVVKWVERAVQDEAGVAAFSSSDLF